MYINSGRVSKHESSVFVPVLCTMKRVRGKGQNFMLSMTVKARNPIFT